MNRLILTLTLILASVQLLALDLNSAWQAYDQSSTHYLELRNEHERLLSEQQALKSDMVQLKNSSSWYNGWFTKLLLANNSQRQVELLERLSLLEDQLAMLDAQQKLELQTLKTHYARIAETYAESGNIPPRDKHLAERVGRIIFRETATSISLPDYSSLVKGEYTNADQRRLVLSDLQVLLTTKIARLDSLLEIQKAEAELSNRLAAFHQDLGLQLEAGQDVQEKNQNLEGAGWASFHDQQQQTGVSDDLDYATNRSESSAMPARGEILEKSDLLTGDSGHDSILQTKRIEYEALLIQIEAELNGRP